MKYEGACLYCALSAVSTTLDILSALSENDRQEIQLYFKMYFDAEDKDNRQKIREDLLARFQLILN